MASAWPLTYDATFPGYPYQDEIEYITGEQANSWVSAIQALENGIGFGGATSSSNPLYSEVNNTYYADMASRLSAIEQTHENAVGIDPAAADIQPVGSTSVAGGSGLASDAKHVHQGVKTFNTRSGPVTLELADVLDLLTTPGSIMVGGVDGTGQLLTMGPANSVLQVDPTGSFLEFGSAGSSTVASGDTKFTTAFAVPTGWLAANGAAVSRSTYAALMTATTLAQSVTITNNQETISGISTNLTQFMAAGQAIECAGYIPSGTTITSVSSTSITISNNTTNGGTAIITVFPYGNGNGSTTFTVVDMRGRTPVGYGANPSTNSQPFYAMGATGGEREHDLVVSELAYHTHSAVDSGHSHGVNDPGHAHTYTFAAGSIVAQSGSGAYAVAEEPGQSTGSSATGVSVGQGSAEVSVGGVGSGTGHNNMQPFFAGQFLVKT
jgi:microcystin-dependent protein